MSFEVLIWPAKLAFSLLVAWAVWRDYRHLACSEHERYSTFAPRFWAGPVDNLVMWPVTFAAPGLLALDLPRTAAALLVVVRSLSWLFYTVVMHARYGQTVGKMITKVRVVDVRTEGPISWRQAWLREGIPIGVGLGFVGYQVYGILAGHVSPRDLGTVHSRFRESFWILRALPGLWFAAEVLTMLTNKKRRALHDLIAGTVVIRTNTVAPAPVRRYTVPVPPAHPRPRTGPPLSPVTVPPQTSPAFQVRDGWITFTCRWCQETVSVGIGQAGRLVSCPHCDVLVSVPKP